MSERPLGVTLLGVLYVLFGVMFLILGILGIISLVAVSGDLVSLMILPFMLVEKFVTPYGFANSLSKTLLLVYMIAKASASNIAGGTALAFLLLPGTIMAFTGGGLLKLFNWARKSALAFSIAGIIAGIMMALLPPIGTIIGLILALLSIIVLWYLSKLEIEGLFT